MAYGFFAVCHVFYFLSCITSFSGKIEVKDRDLADSMRWRRQYKAGGNELS